MTSVEIAQLVDRLRDTTVVKPGGLPTPDFAASYKLYAALFGPVEKELAGVAKVSVAATGDLLRYPLEALVTRLVPARERIRVLLEFLGRTVETEISMPQVLPLSQARR